MRLLAGLLAALGLALAAPARANDFSGKGVGTAGSEFLTYDVGARGVAMGTAYSAVTNDAYSLYWNPAGLARIPRMSATFMYAHNIADTHYQSAAYAQRISESSVIGAGWRYNDMGAIDRTDTLDIDRGQFHVRHYIGEAGWAQTIYDLSDSEMELSVGAVMRWIHSDMVRRADGYGGDIGVQARFFTGSLTYDFAAVAQNMGTGQNYNKERDILPFRARFGGAVYPKKNLTLSVEGILPINNNPYGAMGVEYGWDLQKNIKANVRAGFNSERIHDLGPFSSMTMGMGVTVSDLTIDYAFVPFGVLGTADVHRVSISFNLPSKVSRRFRER
jgi:hypothetical protein